MLTYHGIADPEHPSVTLDPTLFRAQMQDLRDNHSKVIALRGLAEYLDPAKAAQLPPTPRDDKPDGPEPLASEEKAAVQVVPPPAPAAKPSAPVTKSVAKLDLAEVAACPSASSSLMGNPSRPSPAPPAPVPRYSPGRACWSFARQPGTPSRSSRPPISLFKSNHNGVSRSD